MVENIINFYLILLIDYHKLKTRTHLFFQPLEPQSLYLMKKNLMNMPKKVTYLSGKNCNQKVTGLLTNSFVLVIIQTVFSNFLGG
jgi:hypothetical protein